MSKKSGAFRKRKIYFAQVSNNALRDSNLSLKAKGLYSLIQSYITIENYTLYKTTLRKDCKEGEKAFESTWKELKDVGYLIQYRLQDENGKFYYEYELLDTKDIDLANEVHNSQNRKKQNEKIHTPKKEVMARTPQTIPTKKEVMDNGYSGKVGIYNNTYLNNIDLNNTNLNNNCNYDYKNDATIKKEQDVVVTEVQNIFLENISVLEATKILIAAKNNVDLIKEKYLLSKHSTNIQNIVAWIIKAIKDDYKKPKIGKGQVLLNSVDRFNNYEQRSYDYDKLEKKLLGWE